ncbi:hypothetical protein STEG23_026083, partial [Scotinomys teguina]
MEEPSLTPTSCNTWESRSCSMTGQHKRANPASTGPGSQELPVPNSDSRGYIVRNQWSRTSRSPSTRAPSVDEPRSRNTVVK